MLATAAQASSNKHSRRGNWCPVSNVFSMRINPSIAGSWFLASLMGLLLFAQLAVGQSRAADETRQPVAIQFSFDRPIDGSAAPFMMAATQGLFSSEGLAVTTHIASG